MWILLYSWHMLMQTDSPDDEGSRRKAQGEKDVTPVHHRLAKSVNSSTENSAEGGR